LHAEFFLYLPQGRANIEDLLGRARAAEAGEFDGVAFLDHLETPMAPQSPIWEAMTFATWVAAKTHRLRIGHVVLCDAFRHRAALAKQAVTLAEASGGRFELGLGSGSMPQELARFDFGTATAGQRVPRLARTLGLLKEYWGVGQVTERTQYPTPTRPIPLVLGGRGPRMLGLVREHADWWNVAGSQAADLPTLLPSIGSARTSVLQMVALVRRGSDRATITDQAQRRFGHLGSGLVCGDAAELVDYFRVLEKQGVQRFYVWFADAGQPDSVREFSETVISKCL
jgi:alkanesulfonate monooxygenase SsuD/methylene tetrahydromethanopterin reductase-like flavin-dependent oxidoreductase (luciferase family)